MHYIKLPNLYELAKNLSLHKEKFCHLDVAQLIKHILGLNANYPQKKNKLITMKDNTAKSLKEVEFFLGNWKRVLKGIKLYKILK